MRAADSARRGGSRDGGGDAGRDSSAVDPREDRLCWICDGRELLELEHFMYVRRFSSALSAKTSFLPISPSPAPLFTPSMRFRRRRLRSFVFGERAHLAHGVGYHFVSGP